MSRKAEWLQRLEYAAYRAVAKRAAKASPESVLRWGSRIGTLSRTVVRSRDRRAMNNLRRAFPEKSHDELRRILDECWRHFGREMLNYIRLQQLPTEEVLRSVKNVNLEVLREAKQCRRRSTLRGRP